LESDNNKVILAVNTYKNDINLTKICFDAW